MNRQVDEMSQHQKMKIDKCFSRRWVDASEPSGRGIFQITNDAKTIRQLDILSNDKLYFLSG